MPEEEINNIHSQLLKKLIDVLEDSGRKQADLTKVSYLLAASMFSRSHEPRLNIDELAQASDNVKWALKEFVSNIRPYDSMNRRRRGRYRG